MDSNNRNINKAILDATGYDVKLHKSEGYCHFYSDDKDTDYMLSGFDSTSIYVNTIATFSVEQWVQEFKFLLIKNEERIEKHKEIIAKGGYEKLASEPTVINLSRRG